MFAYKKSRKLALSSSFVGIALLGAGTAQAQTTYYDMVTSGLISNLNGAEIFTAGSPTSSTGSGTFNPYLGLSSNTPIEVGLATSSNTAGDRMASVDKPRTDAFGLVDLGAATTQMSGSGSYYSFYFDINETGADPYLSLDALTIYRASGASPNTAGNPNVDASNLPNFITNANASVVWSLDDLAADKYTVTVDRSLLSVSGGGGSGHGDYYVLIPTSAFGSIANDDYFYIYAEFGAAGVQTVSAGTYDFGNTGGFEEIGIASSLGNFSTVPSIISPLSPAPEANGGATVPLTLGGLALAYARRLRRQRQQ